MASVLRPGARAARFGAPLAVSLLLAIPASAAVVGEDPPASQGVGPLSQEFRNNEAKAFRDLPKAPPPPGFADRASASEIKRSRTAHRGKTSASEVRALVKQAVPELVAPNAIVPPASEIADALSPTTLQLRGKDGKPGSVVTSNMPLAVSVPKSKDHPRGFERANLDFERSNGRINVTRARVAVSLPEAASGVTKFGSFSASFAPDATGEATASVSGDTVTYADTGNDRDVLLRATGAGVKAAWVLRSTESSRSIRVPIDLPSGGKLIKLPGGAVEMRNADGDAIGSISPPTAADVGGIAVPLEVGVDGDTLTIEAKPDVDKTQWPVVVDPDFQANWAGGTNGYDGDFGNWIAAKLRSQTPLYTGQVGGGSSAGSAAGLYVNGYGGGYGTNGYLNGDYASWNRFSPGDPSIGATSPEHAYWRRFDVGGVDYSNSLGAYGSTDPQAALGLLNPNGTGQNTNWNYQDPSGNFNNNAYQNTNFSGAPRGLPSGTAGAGATIWSGNSRDDTTSPGVPDNLAALSLQEVSPYGGNRPNTSLHMGWYRLYAGDNVPPAITSAAQGSTAWTDNPLSVVSNVTATDRGMGVRTIQLFNDDPTPTAVATSNQPCPTSGRTICNFTASVPLLGVGVVSEGRHTYKIRATDGGGKTTDQNVPIAVDTSAPNITLSGDLYNQRDTQIPAGQNRSLSIAATDGDPSGTAAAQRSGVDRVEVYVDDTLVQTYNQSQSGDSQPINQTWTPDSSLFDSGDFTVRVVATDKLGHDSQSTFTVHAPPGSPLPDSTVTTGTRATAFGDFNGDSQSDVALVDRATGSISVALGQGDGSFAQPAAWGTFGGGIDKLVAGNINSGASDTQGSADDPSTTPLDSLVARTSSGALKVESSDGSSFAVPDASGLSGLQTTWPATSSLQLSDVDGDGNDDVWGVDSSTGNVDVGYSAIAGFYATTTWANIPSGRQTLIADLDGDGSADLVTYDPTDGTVRYHQSDGSSFDVSDTWGQGPTNADVAAGDFNDDGLSDIVFRTAASSANVTVQTSSTDGGFDTAPQTIGQLDQAFALGATDITGDQLVDALGTKIDNGTLTIRSIASGVPDQQVDDTTPVDPDQDDSSATPSAKAAAANTATPRKLSIMMSADKALRFGSNFSPKTASDLLNQMKFLGATRVRTIAYWGQIDRLAPSDEAGLVLDTTDNQNPPTVPLRADGSGPQDESHPPARARTFLLPQDAPGSGSKDFTQTVDDPQPEWIAHVGTGPADHGEWVTVRHRLYIGNLSSTISKIRSC